MLSFADLTSRAKAKLAAVEAENNTKLANLEAQKNSELADLKSQLSSAKTTQELAVTKAISATESLRKIRLNLSRTPRAH